MKHLQAALKAALLAVALNATPTLAHEVHLSQQTTQAVLLELTYADGQPFAFEAYELYPAGAEMPAQVGRTNAQGQLSFVPGKEGQWRIKAFSGDGHGMDQMLQVQVSPSGTQSPPSQETDRPSRIILGLALILALFGAYQLWGRYKKRSATP